MGAIPFFTAEENLTRIEMEKGVNFVVVEGRSDVPIYEVAIFSLLDSPTEKLMDVVYVGGKKNIITLIENVEQTNFICIADKDFDEAISSAKVVSLSRYSIENFLICEEAISAALAFAMRESFLAIKGAYDLRPFHDEVNSKGDKLLKALFYYHRVISPSKPEAEQSIAWSKMIIHKHSPEWGLCESSINNLIDSLVEDIAEEEINNYFESNYQPSCEVAYDLPGKMLRVLLQQHVARFYRQHKAKGGSQIKSVDTCMGAISSNLNLSTSFTREIDPVLEFLKSN